MQSTLVRVLVVVVGALGLLGGAAFATEGKGTRRADAVIIACATKQGSIRIVDTASACRRSETALKWNVSGPKGDPGAKGDGPDQFVSSGKEKTQNAPHSSHGATTPLRSPRP